MVNLKTCAAKLGMSTQTLRNWHVPSHSVAGRRWYNPEEVLMFLQDAGEKQKERLQRRRKKSGRAS